MFAPYRRPDRDWHGWELPSPEPSASPSAIGPAAASPAPSTEPAPAAAPAPAPASDSVYGAARRAMRVLPLGAGFVLVGLGLGFLALRMRRG